MSSGRPAKSFEDCKKDAQVLIVGFFRPTNVIGIHIIIKICKKNICPYDTSDLNKFFFMS